MRNRKSHGRFSEHGISIIELLVGVVLLAVVSISLAASSMYASRTMARGRMQLEAVEFLQSELERVLAVPYGDMESGTRTTAKGTSTWTVADSSSYSRIILVTHYAPTEGASMWDTAVAYRLKP